MELAEGLATRSPRDPDVLECLGVDYHQLAQLVLQKHEPQKAEALSRRGIAACEAVAALDPARPRARLYRIKNAVQLGHTYLWRGVLPEALAAFEPALELARRWTHDQPHYEWISPVILEIEAKMGDGLWLLAHDWNGARGHYLEAIDIARRLVAENPDRLQNQVALAMPLVNLGEYTLQAGHPTEARSLLREAEQIAGRLAKADPNTIAYQLLPLEVQALIAGTEMAEGRYEQAARLLRPAIERLQSLKDQGKLEGQPIYGIQYLRFWKNDLAYFEAAPSVLKDAASVRLHPPDIAIKLLRFRARTLKDRGDRPGLVSTVDTASAIQCRSADEMLDLAAFYAECINSFDAIQSATPPGPDNTDVRSRCAGLGIAALAQAVDHGFRDAHRLETNDRFKPLRSHPGFRPLIERMQQPATPTGL